MKIKIVVSCLFFITLLSASCKKESVAPPIVGKWMNTAVYSDPANGGFGWETVVRFNEVVLFEPDAKFSIFTDVPEGAGTYNYNRSSNQLQLQFEADNYGNPSRSASQKVEILTSGKLVTVIASPVNGMIYKREYTRVN